MHTSLPLRPPLSPSAAMPGYGRRTAHRRTPAGRSRNNARERNNARTLTGRSRNNARTPRQKKKHFLFSAPPATVPTFRAAITTEISGGGGFAEQLRPRACPRRPLQSLVMPFRAFKIEIKQTITVLSILIPIYYWKQRKIPTLQ